MADSGSRHNSLAGIRHPPTARRPKRGSQPFLPAGEPVRAEGSAAGVNEGGGKGGRCEGQAIRQGTAMESDGVAWSYGSFSSWAMTSKKACTIFGSNCRPDPCVIISMTRSRDSPAR